MKNNFLIIYRCMLKINYDSVFLKSMIVNEIPSIFNKEI